MRHTLLFALTGASLSLAAHAQPISVPSDPGVSYRAVEIKAKPNGMVEILTRRQGPSGISFSLREIDCRNRSFRYLGEGDTREEAARAEARNRPNNRMGQLTEGSISTHVANFACSRR